MRQRPGDLAMNDTASLFSLEERLAEESRACLEAANLDSASRMAFARLLDGYGTLLRETKQLIKLSDRKEKELNRLNQKLRQLTQSLAYQAEHDALTGCLNKAAMGERIRRRMEEGELCLALIDLDHFKQINDFYGHPAGDAVLRGVAELLHDRIGPDDWLGRMGGEEFAVLMPQRSLLQARALLDELRLSVEAATFTSAGQKLQVTFSAGLSLSIPGEGFDSLYQRVDMAMYEAKHGGRNRVVAHG